MDDLLNEFSLSFETVILNLSFFLFKMFLNTFYNYLFSISSLFLSYSSQEPVRISGWRVSFESSALKLLYFDWRFVYCRCLVLILTRLLPKFNTSKEVKRYLEVCLVNTHFLHICDTTEEKMIRNIFILTLLLSRFRILKLIVNHRVEVKRLCDLNISSKKQVLFVFLKMKDQKIIWI